MNRATDDNLATLLRMAQEVETFERAGELHLTHASATPRELTGVRSGMRLHLAFAVAAGLALAAGAWISLRAVMTVPAPKPQATGESPVVVRPVPARVAATGSTPNGRSIDQARAMVLAVFRGDNNECGCVVWREAPFASRDLADVSRTELIDAAMAGRCSPPGDLLLVMGLKGPAGALPPNAAAAEALASCVTGGPEACGVDGPCYAANAMRCLPENVAVIAEAVK